MSDPVQPPPQPRSTRLAGEQVTDNTRNIGATMSAVVMVIGIGKEYGINLGSWLDPRWVEFLTDPRIIVTATSVAIWVGNTYRKSRLRAVIRHQLDRLDGEPN
jgi:hypothetical protein